MFPTIPLVFFGFLLSSVIDLRWLCVEDTILVGRLESHSTQYQSDSYSSLQMDHNEPEQRRKDFGLSDLHVAVLSNDMAIVRRVLKSNNSKEALQSRDQDGATPLMTAVLCGRFKFVQVLLCSHASTRDRDRQGRNAEDYTRSSPVMKYKLELYKSLGFRISNATSREKRRISETLRYPAALWS